MSKTGKDAVTFAEETDPYRRIAELYDLEHDSFRADVEMYQQFVEAAGDPVLEIGVGTGRIALPITELGFRVTGLDPSPAMLTVAAEKNASNNLTSLLTLQPGGLLDAATAPGGPFGVIILALDVLLHLETSELQRDALTAAFQALDPRGQLLIDVFSPTPAMLQSFDGSVALEGTWELETGETVDKFSSRSVKPSEQLIDTVLWYEISNPEGRLERIRTSYRHRYLTAAELELMLELTGFQDWVLYGGYDLEPFDDGSERLIVAADVTRTG